MALVNIVNMSVLDNPTCFLNPFQFEITFECLQELDDDLEWKVLYVGSAHDAQYDQILDEILVGPIPVGLNKFILQADAPNIDLLLQQPNISSDDILGVTVVLVTCSYKEREFVRIGYYVNNEYLGYENMTIEENGSNIDNNDNDDESNTNKSTMQSSPSQQQQQQAADGTIITPSSTTTTEPQDQEQGETSSSPPSLQPTIPKISIYDIDFQKVQRQILADKPRVTKFPIPWNISDTTTTTTNNDGNTTTTTTTSFTNNNLQQQQENVENNNNNNNTTFSHVAGSLSSPSTTTTTSSSFMNHPDKATLSASFQQQQHTTFTN